MSENTKIKSAIVFGANGYIGSHLVFYLRQMGCAIQAYDIQSASMDSDLNYSPIDISNKENLNGIDWNVDYVFLFAGLTGTYNGFDSYQKFTSINEIGLLHVLDGIKNSGYKPKVIFPSTRLVYKGADLALKEDDEKEAKTVYAANKIACEYLLAAYANAFDIPYTVYRICVPYGNMLGKDYSYGTIGFFLSQARKNGLINLYGDGKLRRTFSHVEDICTQIITTCGHKRSINQVFNIAGEDYSLEKVAKLIADKYNAEVGYVDWPEKDLRIESGHTVFDASKSEEYFNFKYQNELAYWISNIE